MEAGTHHGWAKCACPMKHVGFEGVSMAEIAIRGSLQPSCCQTGEISL